MARGWTLGLGAVALAGVLAQGCASSEDASGPPGSGGALNDSGTDGSGGSGLGSSTFPSCSDGKKGETETDVDCGGNCPPCDDKLHCETAADCTSGICFGNVCGGCDATSQCPADLQCIAHICQPCTNNSQCAAGEACDNGKCGACGGAQACASGQACINGTCGPCSQLEDCGGGMICTSGLCGPCGASSQCAPGQICEGGACGPCADASQCEAGQICQAGKCGPCGTNADCSGGEACIGGACGACTSADQCEGDEGCVNGACGACTLTSQCGSGEVCDFGRCLTGTEVQMYQCPEVTPLGGGSWGFYGCQNQIASTSTCHEIEFPTQKDFPCTPVGKLALVTATAPAAPGTTQVQMYQCPGITSLGGGAWAYYACQGQLSSTATCHEIEYPTQKDFPCTPVGKMSLASSAPTPPPGGKVVPMYQCPGVTSLGGGSWGFYGCQNQLSSTATCHEIEYPTQKDFPCTPAGSMVLGP